MSFSSYIFRLTPGQDLKKEIQAFVINNNITGGWVSCCIGSLTQYAIRFANQRSEKTVKGYFEILSVCGTVSINGSHLHICIANEQGSVIGGHLADGNLIYTTAEIVITSAGTLQIDRAIDPATGFHELKIRG